MPWLNEMVRISVDGKYSGVFQPTSSALVPGNGRVHPFVKVSPVRSGLSDRARSHPVMPKSRRFAPLRGKIREAAGLLEEWPEYAWTLDELAGRVHLSGSQFGRVFTDAYGLTPLGYQRMLRAAPRRAAAGDDAHSRAGDAAGWLAQSQPRRHLFREHVGLTPAEYRQRTQERASTRRSHVIRCHVCTSRPFHDPCRIFWRATKRSRRSLSRLCLRPPPPVSETF